MTDHTEIYQSISNTFQLREILVVFLDDATGRIEGPRARERTR
jgi:hypothetical protein